VAQLLRDARVRIGLIGLLGLVVRVGTVLTEYRKLTPPGPDLTDNTWYWLQSKLLARGDGFANPFFWYGTKEPHYLGPIQHSAGHPPLYTMYLAVFQLLGLDSPLSMRIASSILGTVCVIGVGLLAMKITGSERAGMIAALLAALYPNLWINDGLILSESMYAPLMVLLMWMAYRMIDRPSVGRAAAVGGAIGLACLTRSESQTLFLLLGVPLCLWAGRSVGLWRSIRNLAVAVVCGLVVVSPWVIKNLTTFEHPVFLAIGAGFVLDVANCDSTYYGPLLGYTDATCSTSEWPRGADESEIELILRNHATKYISAHADRLPVVIAARIGRIYNVYRPFQGVDLDIFFERRGRWQSWAALWSYYAIGAAAVVGAVSMWRRRISLVPPLALIAMVTVTAASTMGITRYRVSAEVVWVLLGGIGIDAALSWWSRRRNPNRSSPDDTAMDAASSSPISAVDR